TTAGNRAKLPVGQQRAEVAIAHGRRRQRDEVAGRVDDIAVNLDVEEEESAVSAVVEFRDINRPADSSAKVVLAAARVRISKWPVGVQILVGQIPVGRSRQDIGTRFSGEVVKPAADLAEFSGEVRHPPQSGWLDELDRLKGGWPVGLGVARCAPQ